jgi:hypothetical protein
MSHDPARLKGISIAKHNNCSNDIPFSMAHISMTGASLAMVFGMYILKIKGYLMYIYS